MKFVKIVFFFSSLPSPYPRWLYSIVLKGQVHGPAHAHKLNCLFSNLLLILSVNNLTLMYLSDLRVYFKVEVYFRVTWSGMEEH